MQKLTQLILICSLLSGCGIIDNAVRSNDNLLQKTASSLNTTPHSIAILTRSGDIFSVTLKVKYDNTIYHCYYTTSFFITSSVLCSSGNGINYLFPYQRPIT